MGVRPRREITKPKLWAFVQSDGGQLKSFLYFSAMSKLVLVLISLLGSFQPCVCSAKKKIFIGGLIPSYGFDLFGYKAAMELATDTINNNTEVLNDYELIVKYWDTFVSICCRVRIP